MKLTIISIIALTLLSTGCSTYKHGQTPDDVYYSPAKEHSYVKASQNNDDQKETYTSRRSSDEYDDYTSSSDDQYLRMKIQDRYRWGSLDNYDYWYSPSYAFNNYYGYNSFNPYSLNTWGLDFYYSPFASIQPYGWYNNFYPSYGNSYYGHGYGYGYYGYTPVYTTVSTRARNNVSRPLLGGYSNSTYSNSNNQRYNNSTGRYVLPNGSNNNRYNNSNNSVRFNNDNNYNRSNNNTTTTAPVRSYTPPPSSSGSSSGGGTSRQGRH